jgi:hypothetical protein
MQHSWYVGAVSRLHVVNDDSYRFVVCIAADEQDARPEALVRRGTMSALLTHGAGTDWPDRKGESLAQASLEADGVVAMAFATLADALACHGRLKGAGR